MSILVTGGLGYIGSHIVVKLLEQNQSVIVVDNLDNSTKDILDRIRKITNKSPTTYYLDICDYASMFGIFSKHEIVTVIHLAAYKSVYGSIVNPIAYYENNIGGLINLLRVVKEFDIKKFIFSSSATVYDSGNILPLTENSVLATTNPYGTTKLVGEIILQDYIKTCSDDFKVVILRYFNPVGAHKSGELGESPRSKPSNLFPIILEVLCGKRESLKIFGTDYDTPDGTAIRDYIHVEDLARGHIKALEYMGDQMKTKWEIFNLGSGRGYSVLEIVDGFNGVLEQKLNVEYVNRRPGDLGEVWASVQKANRVLGWKTDETLESIIHDTLNFQKNFQ